MWLFIILVACYCKPSSSYQYSSHLVPCDYTTAACECKSSVDVCLFNLDVQPAWTFTRYLMDVRSKKRIIPAKLWMINTTGSLVPYPEPHKITACTNVSLDDPSCSEPITVDGYNLRSIVSVNGRMPGPTLIVSYNQTVVVNVTNSLLHEFTVHWHGLHQKGTPWMDGAQQVSQCGIAPGSSFRYIFRASPAGTHWYHAHSAPHRTDGFLGALIVRDCASRLSRTKSMIGDFNDFPTSHTMILMDWQDADSTNMFYQYTSGLQFFHLGNKLPDPPYFPPPRSCSVDGAEIGSIPFFSGLINGKGRHPAVEYTRTRLSVFTVEPMPVSYAGPSGEMQTDTADSGKYRFRVIGAQGLFAYRLSVDSHKLRVMALDGAVIDPLEVDYIIVNPGERYDFILLAKTASELNYLTINDFWIRAETLEAANCSSSDVLVLSNQNVAEAILHHDRNQMKPTSSDYLAIKQKSIPVNDTCTVDNPCEVLNCPFPAFPPGNHMTCIGVDTLQLLESIPDSQLPNSQPDITLFVQFGFEGMGKTSSVNGRNLRLPSSPLQLADKDTRALIVEHEYCKGLDETSVCSAADKQSQLFPECACTIVRNISTYNQTVRIILSATKQNYNMAHPIHLHGHDFHVVKIGYGKYNATTGRIVGDSDDITCDGNGACTTGSIVPSADPEYGQVGKIKSQTPTRDTVTVPAGGYVIVYLRSVNPGYWLLHCHTELHLFEGMGLVLNEVESMQNSPPTGLQSCGNFSWTVDDFYAITSITSGSLGISCSNPVLVLNMLLISVSIQLKLK